MQQAQNEIWKKSIQTGLIAGAVMIYVMLVGMAELFDQKELIRELLTMGQVFLLFPPLMAGYYLAKRLNATTTNRGLILGVSSIAGLVAAILSVLLVIFIDQVDIRDMFVNASPKLIRLATFELEIGAGSAMLIGISIVLSLLGAILTFTPDTLRRAIIAGIGWTLGFGLLSELGIQIGRQIFGNGFVQSVFKNKALLPIPALIIFIGVAIITILWIQNREPMQRRYDNLNAVGQRSVKFTGAGIGLIILLILPSLLGTYLSEVLTNVGLFVLMGLGLNIAVGLAGLLDLGYVTNFAVGAYLMAVLTSTGPLGVGPFNFWLVLPLCVLLAMFTGFFFALPVLRMRGDYLAIATLGFGEIIRLLALSDWLKPIVGGAQGIPLIPKASVFGYELDSPERLYYLVLGACFLTLFVMLRLNNSRTGRQWMAIREDEDAASAMGIDTTITKVIAFTLSAATGGLAGAIFASKVTAIFPSSFDLLKSVNTLSLIIIGGLGSIPGIVVGAAVLIGLPELLREFSEYRLLMYGALLIYMMLTKPEGLWPSAARKRELSGDTDMVNAVPVSEGSHE
ncbi:MAG: branched-chain amino acid ABC transporter permease [Chloroflexota bacterium]